MKKETELESGRFGIRCRGKEQAQAKNVPTKPRDSGTLGSALRPWSVAAAGKPLMELSQEHFPPPVSVLREPHPAGSTPGTPHPARAPHIPGNSPDMPHPTWSTPGTPHPRAASPTSRRDTPHPAGSILEIPHSGRSIPDTPYPRAQPGHPTSYPGKNKPGTPYPGDPREHPRHPTYRTPHIPRRAARTPHIPPALPTPRPAVSVRGRPRPL